MGKKKPPWDSVAWLRDQAVRSVSLAARGLWKDMLCLMDDSERRGYLQRAGSPLTLEQLCRETGDSTDEVHRLLQELNAANVYSVTPEGIIYNRRMVREERKRKLCSEAGRRGGGNPNVRAGPLKVTFKGRVKGGFKGQAQSPTAAQVTSGVSESRVRSLSLSLLDPDTSNLIEERESVGDRGLGEGTQQATFKGATEAAQPQQLAATFKGPVSEYDNHPAVLAWRTEFGEMPDLFQREAIAKSVTNMAAWQATLKKWKLNGYGLRLGNVLDSYQGNVGRLVKQNGGRVQQVGAPADWKEREQAKAKAEYEKQRQEWEK